MYSPGGYLSHGMILNSDSLVIHNRNQVFLTFAEIEMLRYLEIGYSPLSRFLPKIPRDFEMIPWDIDKG